MANGHIFSGLPYPDNNKYLSWAVTICGAWGCRLNSSRRETLLLLREIVLADTQHSTRINIGGWHVELIKFIYMYCFLLHPSKSSVDYLVPWRLTSSQIVHLRNWHSRPKETRFNGINHWQCSEVLCLSLASIATYSTCKHYYVGYITSWLILPSLIV